jgi:4-hydroxy-tetrahydrodipicolinate synthase
MESAMLAVVREGSPVRAHAMSITPFGSDGAFDERLFRAHLQFLAGAGLDGVYVASQGSGEGDLLSFAEKVRCYAIAVDELHGVVPVVAAGIGLAGSTAAITELATAAAAAGVDAVQILGPRLGAMQPRPAELLAYFRTVIDAVQCDVHLSNNVALAGYPLSADLMDTLLDDRVVALNLSGPDAEATAAFVRHFGARTDVRIGVTAQLAEMAAAGARGFLSFEANVAPKLVADACATMQVDALLRLNAALARGGNPRSLKAALRLIGRDGGDLRAPYLPLDPVQTAELAAVVQNL